MYLSQKIAEFVLETKYDTIQLQVQEKARHCFIDCLGCILAGSRELTADIITKYIKSTGGNPVSTFIGRNFKTSPYNAAMANGVFGHILDYDDMSANLMGHPSVVVLPVVLALGEQEKISGQKAIEAFIVGVEVACAIGRGVKPQHYKNGWHPTSSIGIFGATAAAGKILGLDKQKLINSFGIAASEASGLRENFGTMTKSLHAGRAAAKGILAAILANEGYTSSEKVFEGKAGFLNVMTDKYDTGQIIETLGNSFMLPGISIKFYPSCAATHNGIDAMLFLVREYDIKPEKVKIINCGVVPIAKDILIYSRPNTGLEAKFSMQFCLALALVEREVKLDHFIDPKVQDPNIKNIIKKVNMYVDPELAKLGYRGTLNTIVKVVLDNGVEYIKRVDYAKGDPINPLSENEIINKYIGCASRVLSKQKVEESIKILKNLSNISQINELTKLFL